MFLKQGFDYSVRIILLKLIYGNRHKAISAPTIN